MNQLSLRNDRLKFATSGEELPIIVEESIEYTSLKQIRRNSTCNRLDHYAQKLHGYCFATSIISDIVYTVFHILSGITNSRDSFVWFQITSKMPNEHLVSVIGISLCRLVCSGNFQFPILEEKLGTMECLKQAIYVGHQEWARLTSKSSLQLHLKVTHSSNTSINQSIRPGEDMSTANLQQDNNTIEGQMATHQRIRMEALMSFIDLHHSFIIHICEYQGAVYQEIIVLVGQARAM